MHARGEKNSRAMVTHERRYIGLSRTIMIPQYLIEDIRQCKF